MRARSSLVVGALAVGGGAVAWGLAAAAAGPAARAEAVEIATQPPDAYAAADSAGTVDLLLHDVRLGTLVAVLLGLLLLVDARSQDRPAGPSLLGTVVGGAAALVVGNAVVGRLVDEGTASALLGAAATAGLGAAGAGAGARCARLLRRRRAPGAGAPGGDGDLARLLVAGAGAGTAGALGHLGVGDVSAVLHVASAVTAVVVGVVVLTAVAVVAAARVGWSSRAARWSAVVAALVPGALGVTTLLTGTSLEHLLDPAALLLVPGGVASMVLVAPAGAVIGVDGLPVVGGGLGLGVVVALVLTVVRSSGEPEDVETETARPERMPPP